MIRRKNIGALWIAGFAVSALFGGSPAREALADAPGITCERTVTADVVVIDQPLMFNRLGAANVNGMIFALRRDVIDAAGIPLTAGGVATPGTVQLRPDRRPRPLVLRVREGDCLTVNLENLLATPANPFNEIPDAVPPFNIKIDGQPADRFVGFHAAGMQVVTGIHDDGSIVGANPVLKDQGAGGLVSPGNQTTYKLYAEKEGVFVINSEGVVIGSEANAGHIPNGLFGQLIVEPKGAAIYRGQVHEEEMRLAADRDRNGVLENAERTPIGQPILDYEAVYPGVQVAGGAEACDLANSPSGVLDNVAAVFCKEGKAGLPILNMMQAKADGTFEIVHSEINAVVAHGGAGHTVAGNGVFPPSTYPLESVGKRNPTVPNRLEPFRDFSSQFHDETTAAQAFPGFYVTDAVFKHVLHGVRDGFMINYGSGGIGSEIIANRLGVGPMHDCLNCSYEEFFLSSFTVGDPAMLVDVPANLGLETLLPDDPRLATCGTATPDPICNSFGPKANYAIGAEDPSNVHHSYTGDFTKIRNTHVGFEQHVFHLHNHQWLFNPNDDDSNYLDAQGIGPGVGYTYEINFGGSGNRNKTSGDAIFHCHFYPHFAQGMWYLWRHNDTLQTGTVLAASGVEFVAGDPGRPSGYHTERWALHDTTPAFHPKRGTLGLPADARYRSYPDGEVVAGTPIPAVVPLPGKAMPPMPGDVAVVPNPDNVIGTDRPVGSLAKVIETSPGIRAVHPGYPFWIAGIEDIVGQRATTPPLDMLSAAQAGTLPTVDFPQYGIIDLFKTVNSAQADGWDGGLPRHALRGYAAGGTDNSVVNRLDFSKTMHRAAVTYYPEEGTDLEQQAMAFHARKFHATYYPDGTNNGLDGSAGGFRTNGGGGPVVGAPYHNPCIDDTGAALTAGYTGSFFSGETAGNPMSVQGRPVYNSDAPRIYKGTFIQFDAVFNKVGYHYPQQRIITLWEDAKPVITKEKPPEPLVFRFNTFDCMVYHNSNLVPAYYEMDDYQVRTPTDIIGQHIHLPKWDLTTADGSANGWNYEDGTLSPGSVRERIHAINEYVTGGGLPARGTGSGSLVLPTILVPLPHPYFGGVATSMGADFSAAWLGARTTTQRWFADPVVNTDNFDRGLGIIFTHDHYGPSTHQQIGLYATALTEPAGSLWLHNETGVQLGRGPAVTQPNPSGRIDGGPTSWQAMIIPPSQAQASTRGVVSVKPHTIPAHREFYLEYSDFQHAYEKGVYVGAGPDGLPLAGAGPLDRFQVTTDAPAAVAAAVANNIQNAFRTAINVAGRAQIDPVPGPMFPDVYVEVRGGILPGCPTRPCPGAISATNDPGMHTVNYRNEPVALRVFDPDKVGPDEKPGTQADARAGNLAFALSTAVIHKSGIVERITRAIPEMNLKESALGFWDNSLNRQTAIDNNDPFTPMMRAYAGDLVRVKMQAGGHEEEHTASIHGLKWLQSGSGNGRALNSGWRNAQSGGISEQFTLSIPLVGAVREFSSCGVDSTLGLPESCTTPLRDYAYTMDASTDGWWSGTWGILRGYDVVRGDLPTLPGNPRTSAPSVVNAATFRGICPKEAGGPGAPGGAPTVEVDIVAVLANDILPPIPGVTIPPNTQIFDPVTPLAVLGGDSDGDGIGDNMGGPLTGTGTLVFNPRNTVIPTIFPTAEPGEPVPPPILGGAGPLNEPTAMMYVLATDLVPTDNTLAACQGGDFYTRTDCPVRLKPGLKPEPLVLRAPAGSCVIATLHNRIPSRAPDLSSLTVSGGYVKRDRTHPQGSTNFNLNLVRPSGDVGLHPQLAAFDVTKDDGVNVGQNLVQTAEGVRVGDTVAAKDVYKWYLGDIGVVGTGPDWLLSPFTLQATPVEFGGSSLIPADKIKQPQKSLMGGLVTLPEGSTVTQEDSGDNVPGSGHVAATVRKADGTLVRDFMVVMAKFIDYRYADGTPVEHMSGEGVGIAEDSANNSLMAMNYAAEPMWFRFAIPPHAPFGPTGFGGIANAHMGFSNALTGGNDPVTPVLVASAGQEVRLHVGVPHGTHRGSTLAIHGHLWQRDPYICNNLISGVLVPEAQDGLVGRCRRPSGGQLVGSAGNWIVGSKALGHNPTGMTMGAQESLAPYTKYDFLLPYAGGRGGHTGDYLFRDTASGGTASGLWGILRVAAAGGATAVNLTANPADNTESGNSVTYTATALSGTGPFEYEFRARVAGGAFVLAQPYTPTNTWTWDTTGSPAGGYEVQVNIRQAGTAGPDASATIPYVLTSPAVTVSLTANPADNTVSGNSVTYTATALSGTGPFEYEFRARVAGGAFVLAQPYTPTNTWTWDTTGSPAGGYEVQVNIRQAGTAGPDASATIPYVLTSPAVTVSLTANPADNTVSGNSVTYTATALSGTGPFEYEFRARVAGGAFVLAQPYTPTNTWTWDTTGSPAGGYEVQVNIRQAGTAGPDASATIPYVLTSPAVTVSLTANPVDNTVSGNSVTYTATALSGTGPFEYEFRARVAGGAFVLAQPYTPTNTWTWDTTGSPAGGYEVQVNIRQAGTAGPDASATIPYVLTNSP